MKVSWFRFVLPFFILCAVSTGCAQEQKLLPKNDEVLIYKLPYDLVYLKTMEALQLNRDWDLEETEKEGGVIVVRNLAYSQFGDADNRRVIFKVAALDKETVSVSIDPKSQHVLGGDTLLESISKVMNREL